MTARVELLAQSKRDPLDTCAVHRPGYVVPEQYLPGWIRTPLFNKIPAKSDPLNPVIFTRPRLGKSLHLNFKGKDFDTSFWKDLPLDYNSLHDPHLHRYYRINQRNYFGLIKDRWITPYKDYVACSQADFNLYRDYVRSIMVQEEKKNRNDQEYELECERLRRKHAEMTKQRNRPLEWVKRALIRKKKHNIKLLEELVKGATRTGESEDKEDEGEEDDELMKVKREEDMRRMTVIGEKFQTELRRIIGAYERKENKVRDRDKKASEMWKRMENEEREKIIRIHELKKRQEEEFKRKIAEREETYEKIRQLDAQRLEALKRKRIAARRKKRDGYYYQDESENTDSQDAAVSEEAVVQEPSDTNGEQS